MYSFLRTTIVSIVFCGLILLGYWRITSDQQARTIQDLQSLNTNLQERLEARQAMIERLSRTRRIAHVMVTDQPHDSGGRVDITSGVFIELDDHGAELARQAFSVPGDVLFVDAWTVKFDYDKVAQGDPLAGRTLVLLRRLYSDRIAPKDGILIDTPGAIPPGYACDTAGQFEKRIWENFWVIASDPEQSKRMNIRVAQGEAVYKPVRAGQTYELIVDASGGMSLTLLPAAEQSLTQAK